VKLHAFMTDEQLAGPQFVGPTWDTWRVVARLLDGDASLLLPPEVEIARKLTGRDVLPSVSPREFYCVAGRRSGKTTFAGLMAAHSLAQDYRARMRRGEQALCACVAPTKDQADILWSRARGIIAGIPMLERQVIRETASTLEFAHGTRLEVSAASFRTTRGPTYCLCILDECSYLRSDDSAEPDVEIARAIRPGLTTLRGRLVGISSPHMRQGLLWDQYTKHYGDARA